MASWQEVVGEEGLTQRKVKEKAKETVLTVDEPENALRDLFLECVTFPFPETTLSRLAVCADMDTWFVEAGFRF